jgi:hypothetical protein
MITITLTEYFWIVFMYGFSVATLLATIMWLNFAGKE